MMRFARTIMAFVIALSVAMLPTAGSAIIAAKSTEQGAPVTMNASSDMSAAMDDCCPDHTKPCDQNNDHCQSMASCGRFARRAASEELLREDGVHRGGRSNARNAWNRNAKR